MDHDRMPGVRIGALSVPDGVRVSVAVRDVGSAIAATYGEGSFDTASIVKVDILAALLVQAEDAGRGLTPQERAAADAMIRLSDNAAATELWRVIGGADGLTAAHARLGLVATDPAPSGAWGLTRTTAGDRLTLLEAVFGAGPALNAPSRTYIQDLMARSAAGQDWGVSAAGPSYALKNGWLPRTATGLWVVNSTGRVTTEDGRTCLVAVLSDGNADLAAGVSLVEAAARASVGAVSAAGRTS
ncbi:serine hydrolase [Streptomyces sp. NPDC051219]|uniref:serine hydrolase n=1 Tax=Streptomyces sp. NPDC051219 TaxID=3155283 RepID=UPI00341C0AF4